jgi:5-methylcytosine-specific restriction endonuclease McrA
LTGIEITPKRSSLDHKDPRSLGGADDKKNLQVVLPMVNRSKTNMSEKQFVSMCHAVARHSLDYGDTTWIDGSID